MDAQRSTERDSFAGGPNSGSKGFGIAGPKNGKVELDNITLSTIEPNEKETWAQSKKEFPKFEPIQIKEPKKKKPKQQKPNKGKAKSSLRLAPNFCLISFD